MRFTDLPLPEPGATVAVGMSGGVDSTVVAIILKERGCNVIGVTMSSWNDDMPLPHSEDGVRSSCYGPDEQVDIAQCESFCKEHDIEYHVIDVRETYRKEVLDYFKAEYRAGRTPNPCIRCNPRVKFGALLEGITALGIRFDYFCTGHYARLVRPETSVADLYREHAAPGSDSVLTEFSSEKSGGIPPSEAAVPLSVSERPVMIACASDSTKDQTYFLCRVPSRVLEKVRFPLAGFTKKEVFAMAQERNLAAASRSESQDFVPETYFDVIFSDKPSVPGDIINLDGKVIGRHRGIEHYTVGQRRGLGVSSTRPLYVHSIDAVHNRVVLAENDDLLCGALLADDWVWAGNYVPALPFTGEVKIRLASKPVEAVVEPYSRTAETNDSADVFKITFKNPQRAVAPGQSAVVYLNGVIVGGGIISRGI